ncbi:MAG: S8 family serine peptidase [Actinomycetota bacterium]|nr:S8 family serine peptidase [Actinomycetota bacterium]
MKKSSLVAVLTATVIFFAALQGDAREAQARPTDPGNAGSSVAGIPDFGAPDGERFVPGRILVKLGDGVPDRALEALNRQNDARVEERLPGVRVSVVDLPRGLSVREAVGRYESSPDVEYAEPDFLLFAEATPNDPGYGKLYGLNNTGQTGGTPDADIDAPQAWDTETGDPNTAVAVIDTGVDVSHPDLSGNLWTNPGEIAGDGTDNDLNGYVDDVHGWDFYHDDATVYDPSDGDEHGTHVAGTIAAEGNNDMGVTGVNWRAGIMPLKFLGPDGGSISAAVKAIDYAVSEGAQISNNSYGCGGDCYSDTLLDTIQKADGAGHLFVAAAGNGGSDGVGDDNDTSPHYPSGYDSSNIIAVAATNDDDGLASFSNYGAKTVDLGAPGVGVLSTVPGGYAYFSGTSMATPHVAGVTALLKSQDPLLGDGDLKTRILQYAEPKKGLKGKTVTGGRLNAVAALTQQAAPDETKPTISYVRPAPGAKTKDRTPKVGATVRDDRTDLAKSDIRLYLDGKQRTKFSYNRDTDRLGYTAPKLSYAKHTVRIVARDAAGNTAAKTWSFKVVR